MRPVHIPLPDFLDAAVRASSTAASPYAGIVVIVDRKSERRSQLLDDLSLDASGINDVTRRDLLVAVPGAIERSRPGIDGWVQDPAAEWQMVGAPGFEMTRAHDAQWASKLWDLLGDLIDDVDNEKDQKKIERAVSNSASAVCDYLGLAESDVPSVLLFDVHGHHLYVFRYGGDDDVPLYQMLKEISIRRPSVPSPDWLRAAVADLATEWHLQPSVEAPSLRPSALANWSATRFAPRGAQRLGWTNARG